MVDLNSVNSRSSITGFESEVIANSAPVQRNAQTVPVVADLLSNGVSAALGLQAPTDASNLEVLISQVIEQFEDIRSALKENDLVSSGEKARSARSLLLSALANHEATMNEIVELQERQAEQQATVVALRESLNQKRVELENLPATVPAETGESGGTGETGAPQAVVSQTTSITVDDQTLIRDPEEVARLNAEISELETSLGAAELQLTELTAQIETLQAEATNNLAVQQVLRAAVASMDSEMDAEAEENDDTLSLTSVVRRAAEEIRAGGPEHAQRLNELEASTSQVLARAVEDTQQENGVVTLRDGQIETATVEAQLVIDVLSFIEKTVSESLELAREAIVDQGSIASTGRVKLLLDSGRI